MLNKFYLLGLLLLISCGKNEPLTQVGKLAEGIGQVPQKVGRHLLGIKENKARESAQNSQLENEMARLDAEIQTLLNAIYELEKLVGDLEVNQNALEILLQDYENRLEEIEKKLKCKKKNKKACKR